MSRHWIVAALVLASPTARAQTSYPMVGRVEPAAVRRGTSAELTFVTTGNGGGNISGAFAVLAEPPGLRGEVVSSEKVEPPAATKGRSRGPGRVTGSAKIKLEVAPDAPLGPPLLDAWVRFRDVPDDQCLHAGLLAQFTGHLSIAAAMRRPLRLV